MIREIPLGCFGSVIAHLPEDETCSACKYEIRCKKAIDEVCRKHPKLLDAYNSRVKSSEKLRTSPATPTLADHETLLEIIEGNRIILTHDLSSKKTERLLECLSNTYPVYGNTPSDTERAVAFAASKELSQRGIAPRWQFDDSLDDVPLDDLGMKGERAERWTAREIRLLKQADKIYFDLIWLTVTYPSHITKQKSWRGLFKPEGDWEKWLETMGAIANRVTGKAKKIRQLNLSEEQQMGCRHLCSSNLDTRLKNIESRLPSIERKIEEDIKAAKQRGGANSQLRTKTWAAGKITHWQPSAAARVRTMMTGKEVTKQAMAKAFSKVNKYK